MLRLLAAKFSRSASVPADKVECILADTDRVDPEVVEVNRKKKKKKGKFTLFFLNLEREKERENEKLLLVSQRGVYTRRY